MSALKDKYINPVTDFGFNSLKYYRDLKNVVDTSFEEGEKKKQIEIATNLKKNGVSIEIIADSTGLSRDEVEKL